MEIIALILKYTFVVGVAVEALLILRALANLAHEKARAVDVPATPAEE